MADKKYIIQAVAECLDVFFLLSAPEFQPMTIGEIEIETNLGRSKVYRMLKTLEEKNMVRKRNDRWEVTPDIVKIADGFRRHIAKKRAELEMLQQDYIG